MHRTKNSSRLTGAALAAILTTALPATAKTVPSHITAVTITASQMEPRFNGVPYWRTYGTVQGVVAPTEAVAGLAAQPKGPDGDYHYSAAFEIIAPAPDAPAAHVALIEAENRGNPALFDKLNDMGATGPVTKVSYPAGLGNGFLERHGTIYARVQWSYGQAASIPKNAEGVGLVIMRDFSLLVRGRDAGVVVTGGALPPPVSYEILGGSSQSAWAVDTFIAEGFNRDFAGHRVFDGALAIDGVGNWLAINNRAAALHVPEEPYLDPHALPLTRTEVLHRPATDPFFIDIANYTDFYRLHASLTDGEGNGGAYRRYDWPAMHVAEPQFAQPLTPQAVFIKRGCNGEKIIPLDPIDYAPYARAVLLGLEHAVGAPVGAKLPPSSVFKLTAAPQAGPLFNPLPGAVLQVPAVDASAMPQGGVRFPESSLPLGEPIPVSLPPVTTTSITGVCGNFGGFEPFAPAEIAKRYGSAAAYQAAYKAQLKKLVLSGFILAEDEPAMLKQAAASYPSH